MNQKKAEQRLISMTPLFKKLNYKKGQSIVCLNAPDSFQPALDEMRTDAPIIQNEAAITAVQFALVFATKQAEVDHYASALVPKLEGDAVLWFCYPKGTSKKYKCEFNRDNGWKILGNLGLEGVRMVAIDEDWSALRFRKTQYIKTMTRREDFALSAEGKQKTQRPR
jgi:hypothetical protein